MHVRKGVRVGGRQTDLQLGSFANRDRTRHEARVSRRQHDLAARLGDGAKGVPIEGPFDVIVLSGSVAEVPQSLLANLKIGGRLVAIVGEEPMMRATFVTRTAEAAFQTSQPWDTVAPRLMNFPEPSRFHF